MSKDMTARVTVLFTGHSCVCGRRDANTVLEVLTKMDMSPLGEVRWHPQQQSYCFVPRPQTAWDTRSLREIGLWMRWLRQRRLAGLEVMPA